MSNSSVALAKAGETTTPDMAEKEFQTAIGPGREALPGLYVIQLESGGLRRLSSGLQADPPALTSFSPRNLREPDVKWRFDRVLWLPGPFSKSYPLVNDCKVTPMQSTTAN